MALKLKKVLESKGIPLKNYSALLGISEKTLYNKLTGTTEFTVGEFQKLKTVFPEYDVLYLMSDDVAQPLAPPTARADPDASRPRT